ncbi:S-layer protein [Aphanothece hegewaldii CCALA 016]|uniref:S-layer protein n=1 Tax=Aphanothece hegewaldii CCALA 016 TaxID=2107694 RepID=A0A2T1M174_9CHRO|nr:iron uptake porin [Aphanothece hegewaldii]PSF38440.1 S-layer protein [Aphanothece hegewaldii CCALA 016]
MSKLAKNLLKAAPIVLGASFLAGQSAIAAPSDAEKIKKTENASFTQDLLLAQAAPQTPATEAEVLNQINRYNTKRFDSGIYNNPMSQVTSVNQLRDVEPTAWAFEALRSLVERYGCIVGYPDRTFRGNRALSRWEFAAGLNACMNVMERLIQDGVGVLREDIDKLKRLAQEFESELAALGARVDNLEQRVAFLEDHQFSTTTKLKGEVIFSIADTFGDRASGGIPDQGGGDETQTVFQDRVRLNFETSFTGKDLLRTRLQAGNFGGNQFNARSGTGTNMTRLAYDDGTDNDVTIDDLWYRTGIGPVTLWVGTSGLNLDDVFDTGNPYLSDSGIGALSRGQRYNNLLYRGPSGAGGALKFGNDFISVTAAYLAGEAANPVEGAGLFNGDYSAGAQIGFNYKDYFKIAATYIHTYQENTNPNSVSGLFGGVSSLNAEFPFDTTTPMTADRYGLQASTRIAFVNLAAWGGFAQVQSQDKDINFNDQDVWTWNVNASLVDLLVEGSLFWVGGGMPPKANEGGTSYMVETGFRIPVTKNIFVTPGGYVVFNPNNDGSNDAIYVGVLRTTFKF